MYIFISGIFPTVFKKSYNLLNLSQILEFKVEPPQNRRNSFVWEARAKQQAPINTRTSGQHHPFSVTIAYFPLLQISASFTSQTSSGNETGHTHLVILCRCSQSRATLCSY